MSFIDNACIVAKLDQMLWKGILNKPKSSAQFLQFKIKLKNGNFKVLSKAIQIKIHILYKSLRINKKIVNNII